MKKNDKFILIVFLIIIFGVLVWYPIKYVLISTGISSLDYNNFKEYVSKPSTSLKNKLDNIVLKTKTSIENRVTNYFPFYDNINYEYSNLRLLNKFLYNNYDSINLKQNSNGEYLFLEKETNTLFYRISQNEEELNKKLLSQIKLYNSMVNDDIDLYIYAPNRYEFTLTDNTELIDMQKYIDKFKKRLNKNIKFATLDSSNIDEYNNNFYKTDHHWNGRGAYKGYVEISFMMGIPSLSLNINNEVEMRGSLAKVAAITNITDTFETIDFQNKCEVLVNDKKNSSYKPKKILESNNKFFDYYISYYNGMFEKVEYNCNNDKENLLIFADSNIWAIDEILASQFNKTYIINMKYVNNNFYYKEFIKTNNISKVLVVNETPAILFDYYNYN